MTVAETDAIEACSPGLSDGSERIPPATGPHGTETGALIAAHREAVAAVDAACTPLAAAERTFLGNPARAAVVPITLPSAGHAPCPVSLGRAEIGRRIRAAHAMLWSSWMDHVFKSGATCGADPCGWTPEAVGRSLEAVIEELDGAFARLEAARVAVGVTAAEAGLADACADEADARRRLLAHSPATAQEVRDRCAYLGAAWKDAAPDEWELAIFLASLSAAGEPRATEA